MKVYVARNSCCFIQFVRVLRIIGLGNLRDNAQRRRGRFVRCINYFSSVPLLYFLTLRVLEITAMDFYSIFDAIRGS